MVATGLNIVSTTPAIRDARREAFRFSTQIDGLDHQFTTG
ncbi:hypothetical protein THTE_3248 [Thermogutta terrifontis]|uniref:Uncharacterized protein n=1 Tax=Thermogutta terrifontis TaxID=1331910 RepID=A0A286RIQ7_9BACT|nr:hypothetical protein THTE_3248 [Thermogutta terrifontis]